MAENNYIVPRFDNQSSWAAYNQENQRLQRKKKWGTVFNNMAGLMDPNHISSGKKAENDKRINNFSTSGMTGLMQQMKLMKAADKEQIERELNSRLLTEMPNLKSASDFNQWFQSQGPYVSPYYKTFFSTWAAGQSENRAAQDQEIKLLKPQANQLANKLLPFLRGRAIEASKSMEDWDDFTEEVLRFVDTNEDVPSNLRYLVKDRIMEVLSNRHNKRSAIRKEQVSISDDEAKKTERSQKSEARLLERSRVSTLANEWNDLSDAEKTDQNRLEFLGRELAEYEYANPYFSRSNVNKELSEVIGTGAELRGIVQEIDRKADRIKEDLEERAGIVLDGEAMQGARILAQQVAANPDREAELTAAFVNTLIAKGIQAQESGQVVAARSRQATNIIQDTLGGSVSERKKASSFVTEEARREKKFAAWTTNRLHEIAKLDSGIIARELSNDVAEPKTREQYEINRKALAQKLADDGSIMLDDQTKVLNAYTTKYDSVLPKTDTTDIFGPSEDIAKALKPTGNAYMDSKAIERVIGELDWKITNSRSHLATMQHRAKPRMEAIYARVWGSLLYAHGEGTLPTFEDATGEEQAGSGWKGLEEQMERGVAHMKEAKMPPIEISEKISAALSLAENGSYGIPADIILWRFFPTEWTQKHGGG